MTRILLLPVVVIGLLAAAPASAPATTFSVTNTADDVLTPNSLRWAIAQANADATAPVIDIQPGLTIDLTCLGGGALAYDNAANLELTINANGSTIRQTCAGDAVITTNNENLVVTAATLTGGGDGAIAAGAGGPADVRVEGSTVTGNTGGAAVEAFTGDVVVVDSLIHDNQGSTGGGIAGVFVSVESSTISSNSATSGGGIWSDQTATVINSTITGNTASNTGGGVLTTNSDATLVYATIVGNTAPAGSNVTMLTGGDLAPFATVIAAPLGGGTDCDLAAGVTPASLGFNFGADASCALAAPTDTAGGDPQLGALDDNGGTTPTMLPAAASPLLDRVDCAAAPGAIAVDQRGVARPQGVACDIGAVEVVPPPAPTTTTTTTSIPPAPATTASSPAVTSAAAELPATGAPTTALAIGAVALVGLGALMARAVRRR